jgi:hypothetical protein
MERLRFWNFKNCYLDGSIPGNDWMVKKRPDCQLCGLPSTPEPQSGCFINNATQVEET